MDRRKFVQQASMAAAGLTIINFPIRGKNAPSNKVVVAVMGVNSRGAYLAKCYSQLPNVEVAYICDVEEKAIANGFDALIIAAPDHWHTPAAILGVSHDKHVYVEKPCGQNPYEGELLVEAMN